MASPQWAQAVHAAFHTDAHLTARILDAASRYPGELPRLFGDMAKHVTAAGNGHSRPAANAKKRKLNDGDEGTTAAAAMAQPALAFECKNVSFALPARKKLTLQIVADQSEPGRRELRLLNSATGDAEYALANAHIDHVFCLPVPEKQQRQANFVVFPTPGATARDGTPCEPVVFAMNENTPRDAHSSTRAPVDGDSYVTVTRAEMDALLQPSGSHVVTPTDAEFASSLPQPHRRGEKAYHVKAHRGTKEGYLFFLPNGIVFGFRKPLSFFPFSSIASISYTSVLQRTFNLVISATEGARPDAHDVEFAMLDQADFAGIDAYIKRHGLNDASMAATRRAKEYHVNKDTGRGEANGAGDADVVGGDGGRTPSPSAEQRLQDAEDEEEEDYVQSGGESDGEGQDSDEEEGGGGGGGGGGGEQDEDENEEEEDYPEVEDEDGGQDEG